MTAKPHPQRCETCMDTECDLHPESQASLNPDTGYEWDHYHWYRAIIERKGCASHSSAKSEQEIREKVLDEAFNKINMAYIFFDKERLRSVFAELRQGEQR